MSRKVRSHKVRVARRPPLVVALGAASCLALAACSGGGGSSSSSSPSSEAAGATVPSGPTPTGAALCGLTPPAVIQSVVGVAVRKPLATVHGAVTSCTFVSQAGLDALGVSVHYDTDTTTAGFAKDKTAFADDGEKTSTVYGLGTQAFSSTVVSDNQNVNTVVVLKGTTEWSATAPATLDQVEALARQVLPRLQ